MQTVLALDSEQLWFRDFTRFNPQGLSPDNANMNPMNGPSGPPSIWQEARNSDGRAYYYNVQTKATQWAKPLELMTPVEVRIHRKSH